MTAAACPAPIIGGCRSVRDDRTAADSLRNIPIVLTIAGVVFVTPAAFAQSGSTGGSIGKAEKSISGDQESGAPDARPQRRKERSTVSGPALNKWPLARQPELRHRKIQDHAHFSADFTGRIYRHLGRSHYGRPVPSFQWTALREHIDVFTRWNLVRSMGRASERT